MPARFKIQGEKKLNFGCGYDIRPASEGWVNLDGFVDHPDVVKHDFATVPYPFEDDSFDWVYASHVFEHIPIVYESHNGVRRDILFSIMEELHRILKPGGRLHVLTPRGGTVEAMTHVQHYREWFPKSFNYFENTPAGTEPSKYHTADFVVDRIRFNRRDTRWPNFMPLGRHRLGLFDHLRIRMPWLFGWILAGKNELEALLIARKTPRPTPTPGRRTKKPTTSR